MVDAGQAVAGNFLAFGIFLYIVIMIIISFVVFIISKKDWFATITFLLVGIPAAIIPFFILGISGAVATIIILILVLLGLMKKLPGNLSLFLIFGPKLPKRLSNLCCFTAILMVIYSFLGFGAGAGVGIVVAIIILIIALIVCWPLLPAMGEAGAGGLEGMEGLEGAEGGEGENFLRRFMNQRGGEEGGETAGARGQAPRPATEEVTETEREEGRQTRERANQEESQEQEEEAEEERSIADLQEQIARATPAEAKTLKLRLQSAQLRLKQTQQRMKKFSKRMDKFFGDEDRRTGRGARGFVYAHKILVVLLIIMLFFGIPYLMSRAPTGSAAQRTGSSILDSLWGGVGFAAQGVSNAFTGMADWFTTQFQTCELGPTGVPCKALKIRSCEPFCVSPTGEKAWKGFSIKRLAVVPTTIYDYQGFSVLGEFANEGEGTVQFTTPGEPQFSFFQEGGKSRCQFGLAGWLNWDGSCTKVFPISQDQPDITRLASGKCAEENGELARVCALEPGDVTQLRWFGFKTDSDKILEGVVAKPSMTITIPYTFIVPNDLVGSVAVQTFQEQLTASTSAKGENKIINKINRAYSPPGPLMMAMGTAEDQVVSTIPSTFLIQFANKGKGTVTGLRKENIKIYLPPESSDSRDFAPVKDELCDFTSRWGRFKNDPNGASVDKLDKKTPRREYGGKTEYEAWNPGPGFENYVIYEPKRNIKSISSSSDINSRTLLCVLQTPRNVDKVKTYDFKMRVLSYQYEEQKTASITIIGTSLSSEGIVNAPKTLARSLLGTKGDCARGEFLGGVCNSAQTVSFGKPYYVREIKAQARHGGDGWFCTGKLDIKFTAQKEDKSTFDLGTAKDIGSQETKGVKKSFGKPTLIQSVTAQIPESQGGCKFVDDVSATITYVTPPAAKFVYLPTKGKAPLAVKFNPFESKIDGVPESLTWNFGDGSSADVEKTTDSVVHTYATAGTYKIVLTVKDQNGLTDTASSTVTVS